MSERPMPLGPRKFLQYSQVLDCFPPAVRKAIYAKAEYRTYKKGEYIFHDGEPGPYFLAGVMSGRLRVNIRSREGKTLIATMIEKGELFGEMSVFDDLPRAHDVVAETESTVMKIMATNFIPQMLACPDATLALFRIASRRKRHYVRMVELLALQNVKQKLGRHLLHLAQDYGTEKNGAIVIKARLSQADIGSQLGITRESVNKNLNAFADLGLLAYKNETITLLDPKGLKEAIYPKTAKKPHP
jgi:CRP-like cAMP-binding protein